MSLIFYNKNMSFTLKSKIFNYFFAHQCSLIPNNNSILLSELKLLRQHILTSCDFFETGIFQMINSEDTNQAHCHDKISIRMLKLCGGSVCRALKNVSKTSLNTGKFPLEWQKGNVITIHKKDDKWHVKSYRSLSLI